MDLQLKVSENEADLLKALIEEFWEFESSWGASAKARLAAITWQEKLSYETMMDIDRKESLIHRP